MKYVAAFLGLLLLAGGFVHFQRLESKEDELAEQLTNFRKQVYSTERFYIENLPIYEDWTNGQKEKELRRFLLQDHLAVVEKTGLEPVATAEEIQEAVRKGALINLEQDQSTPYYFYNVRKEHRYLHPASKRGLEIISARFQKVLHRNLDARDEFRPVVVKFAISSALRPVEYQKDLRKRNANASFVSSHSYGLSFDLFYDSYYVNLRGPKDPENPNSSGDSGSHDSASLESGSMQEALDEFRIRAGFLLGASLRRQFRAALAETLLQLQEEGILYAIFERNQRCYHVTIRPDAVQWKP